MQKDPLGCRLLQGDEGVLNEVLKTLGPRAEKSILRKFYTLNDHDIEDILSVALYKLWRGRERYDATKPLEQWFTAIAFNVAKDLCKLLARRSESSLEIIDDPVDRLHRAEPERDFSWVEPVKSQLEQLSDTERRIVTAQGVTSKELGKELGMTDSNVRQIKRRVLCRLRRTLGRDGAQDDPAPEFESRERR